MRSGDLYHETYTESVTIDMSQFGYATEVEQFIQHATGDEIVEVVITFDEAPEGFVELSSQTGESNFIPAVTGSPGDILTLDGSGDVVATAPVELGDLALLDTVGSAQIDNGAVSASKLDGQTKQRVFEECLTFANGLTTWSAVVSGTGAQGQQKPRYSTPLQSNGQLYGARVTTAGGTTGTNAAAMYLNTLPLWLADGFGMSGKAIFEVLTEVSVLRWGFIGNDTAPTSTGAPAYGIWFSIDPGTYGDYVVRVHTANGGAVTTTSTGITAAVATVYAWAIEFESTSSVKFYFGASMPLTPTSTHTTGIPSGNQPQQGGPFAQIVKIDPASASWAGLIIPFWRLHLDPARHDERYA